MGDNPFADLIPNNGSSEGDASPSPTPFTSYSIPAAVGGADEAYDPDTAKGLGVRDIRLTPGVVAVNPSVNPLGTVFLNKDTGEAYIAADRHGNRNPNVVDIYKDPTDYKAESGHANFIPIDQIPLNEIPKSPAELRKLLANYGKVPASSVAHEDQNPFADLIPNNKKEGAMEESQQAQDGNPFADLIPKPKSYGSTMEEDKGIAPSAATSSSMPWYSALGRSATAQTAASVIRQAEGLERASAAPLQSLPQLSPELGPGIGGTTAEANAVFDKAISDRQSALTSLQNTISKRGFTTADDTMRIKAIKDEISKIQSQKPIALASQEYTPESQQQLLQRRQEASKTAAGLEQKAQGMFPVLGVSPTDTSVAAGIGRGVGNIVSMVPEMLTGPLALPLTGLAMGSQAYAEGYNNKAEELKKQGVTDPNVIEKQAHASASQEAVKTVPQLAAYMVGGKLTSDAVAALMKGAAPAAKGIVGGTAAAGANVITSAGLRGLEGQPITPTPEGLTQDILFGAFHGLGTGLQARSDAKKAADAQLGGKEPQVAPSSIPNVNEKEAIITAKADDLHETPAPVINIPAATPEELAKVGEAPITPETPAPEDKTQKIADLSIEQLEHEPGSAEHTAIQQQIDELQKPAEAPIAEAQPETPNAVQEQTTGEVGVRNAPAVGEGVGGQNKAEVPATQGEEKPKEEVTPFSKRDFSEDLNQSFNKKDAKGRPVLLENSEVEKMSEEQRAMRFMVLSDSISRGSKDPVVFANLAKLYQESKRLGEVKEIPSIEEYISGKKPIEITAEEVKPQPKNLPATGQEVKEEVTTPASLEEAKTPEEVDAFVKKQRAILPLNFRDKETLGKRLKALGMQAAAKKRQLTGNLTAKEAAAKAKKEESNYIGKPVSVDGRNGTIIGNPFGRVKVRFEDGNESTHLPEKIESPVEAKPESKPTEEVTQPELPEIVKWADKTIKEGQKRLNTGLDPELLFAYAVKSAHFLGVRTNDFARWSKQMVKEYGERIQPYLETIWGRVRQHASGEYNLIDDPFWKKNSGKPEEGEEAYTPSKIAWSDAARDMFGIRIHPSELPSFNDVHKISKWPEPLRDLATVNDVSYQLNKETDVAGNEILDIATTPMEEESGTFAEKLGDFGGASFRNRLRRDIQKRNDAIERIKEKTKGLYTDEEILEKASELPHAGRIYAEDISARAKESRSRLETWADNTIKESRKRLNVGLDPEVLSAYAVKGAFKIARGVRDFTAWSKEMLSEFGDAIRPHLEDLWNRANQLHNEEAAKYGPKPPSEREVYAKRVEEQLSKVYGRNPTAEEVGKYVDKKFPKAEVPAPVATPATEGQPIQFGTSRATQEEMLKSGIGQGAVPSIEPMTRNEMIQQGKDAISKGADPEEALSKIQSAEVDKNSMIARAHIETLASNAYEALRKFGANSEEYKEANRIYNEYNDRYQQNVSSVAGRTLGQQAFRTELKMDNAFDFQRQFNEDTKGSDLSASQLDKASKLAKENTKANEETQKAQDNLEKIRDEGFSDVDVETPESVDEARQKVADLSDPDKAKQKAEIDQLNQENEQIKNRLEEANQRLSESSESLRDRLKKENEELRNQLEEAKKEDPLVKRVIDALAKGYESQMQKALERIRQRNKEGRLMTGLNPADLADHVIVGSYHITKGARDFTKWSAEVVKTIGENVKPYLEQIWNESWKQIDKDLAGSKDPGATKARSEIKKVKAKAKRVSKMSPEEKRANNIRKRIERNQQIIDDINNGKISSPKDVQKVTNEEIRGLEDQLKQVQEQLKEAKLKEKKVLQFGGKITDKLNPEQAKTIWETAKKFYIPRMTKDAFYDEHRLIADIADDFGLTPNQVREAFSMPRGARKASNDLYQQQQKRKQVLDNSRRWLIDQSASAIGKIAGKAAESAFKLSVLGHGTAFITTHALPLWATNPIMGTKAFLRAMRYTFTGKNGRTQWIIDNHNIVNHPDYEWAMKGGADVNPFRYGTEKPQRSNPDSLLAKALDPITGGRGFDALHWMRMEYFSKYWRKLSPALQNEEMAKVIGDAANTATGYAESKLGSHPLVRLALFAPKLYKSQFKWLVGDPAKMLGTAARMAVGKDVSPADAWQARHEAVNKVKFIGMYAGLLGLNQAILSATGSNAQVNFTDPKKHDWLAFKTSDGSFNPLHPFLSIGRLLAKETHDLFSDYIPSVLGQKTALEKSPGNNVKLALHDLGDYAFGKLSPIARDIAVVVNQRDFTGNAVPWSSVAPLRGKEKLTWPQFLAEMFSPIPFAEASTQKDWASAGAAEKLGSALLFGVPYTTKEDEERWEASHKSKAKPSGGSGGFGARAFKPMDSAFKGFKEK